jgi:hypothetical protein
MTMKALAFDPKHRYQTALAFQEDIDEFLRQIPDAPSSHDIAKFISDLFDDERQAMAEVIRMAMATPNLRTPTLHDTDEHEPALTSKVRRRMSFRNLTTFTVITASLTVLAVILLRLATGDARPLTKDRAIESPRSVTLRVSATPSDAVLTVDNWPTHENPVTLRLPEDTLQHEIRAVLRGYETVSRFVRLERDLSLDLVLQKTATPASLVPAGQNSSTNGDNATARRKKVNAASGADSSCDPPHYYKDGLKYFKRHCL